MTHLDELLQPISVSSPCGEDLSYSVEFDAIAELRREDDPTLSQGAWVTALKVADWPAARARCAELLATRSKDLRLAMWWAEAALLIDGYRGLEQGLRLCHRLGDAFWIELHPRAEAGDLEQRVGHIRWLLGRIVALASRVPAVNDKPTPQDLREGVAALRACEAALSAWQESIDAKLGHEGPSFAAAREALHSVHHQTELRAREAGALGTPSTARSGNTPLSPTSTSTQRHAEDSAMATAAAVARPGPLQSREQALAQLREVAAFFRATEPHSPVAYLAEKAADWGGMPLHLWLRSVLKDAGSLAHVEELLGLQPPAEGAG